MPKSLMSAIALSVLATVGLAGIAQAHHKTGHCFPPGVVVAGCPLVPTGPQLPKPNQGN
ncbi:MAG: hypothetical protein K8F92_06285 [Hyphomicrobium sp.]|uniref:hypothetical protein n=1 Tax=Hyphomicrobium sp. TaxID=82 RepID=UPI0025BEE8B5|nr:hypothetical protein [Hyphomicrobium sp.]MBZ0209243.1 hypothetical protein [Hyphomicrobium sp.]